MRNKISVSFKRVGFSDNYVVSRLTNRTTITVNGKVYMTKDRISKKVVDKLCESSEYTVSVT